MKAVAIKLYEGMFLVDSALAASDWRGVNDAVKGILDKVGANIISLEKWDERRLAYDINGTSRGTYLRAVFNVEGPKVAEIERAVALSEQIMRVLVLNVEGIDEEALNKARPSTAPEAVPNEAQPKAEEAPADKPADVQEEAAPEPSSAPEEAEVAVAPEAEEAEKQQ